MLQNMKSEGVHFHFMRRKSWWALTRRGQTSSPLVTDTICPGCPRHPPRECLGRDWQTLQIQCLHRPLGEYSQNHSPTPVRWSPQRSRSGRWSSAWRRASGLHAGCPPPSETSPRLEVPDWFLQHEDTGVRSLSRSYWRQKVLQAVNWLRGATTHEVL